MVPVVMIAAGVLFATSAHTAQGTDLRNDRRFELSQLIEERKRDVDTLEGTASRLRRDVDASTGSQATSDARIAEQQRRLDEEKQGAGLTALAGRGLAVRLDDAPRRPDGARPADARADDLVVHQQDVQAVVNALWAGGAEAMTIMGQRIIGTSAVRCVGNTLLLQGQVYSPPFVIKAIGDPKRLRSALDAEPGVQFFQRDARDYGLGYSVTDESEILAPAYTGSTDLSSAEVAK